MRRIFLAAALLPISIAMMAFFAPTVTRVKFAASDWDAAEAKAKAEKKLYFVDFDASYCASCRNMDESTYQDPALASYIEQNVVALRLDVQDFDGIMWSQKYEVEALPTMLIFDEQGKLVKRMVGYKSAKDLMSAFQEASNNKTANNSNTANNTAKTSGNAAAHNAGLNPSVQPATEDDRPALKPVTSKTTTNNTGTKAPVVNSDILKEKSSIPAGKGLYEFTIRRAQSSGFSIQLGVFSSYEVLMEQADRASQKFSNQKTMVHVDAVGGQQVFKLLIGSFKDKREANSFRESLRKAGFDGILKDLSVMK